MRIALYHNLPSGGARRAVFDMVKGLAERGHMLDEFCPQTADCTFLPLNGYVRRTVVLPFRRRGVWSRRLPLLTPYVTALRLTRDLHKLSRVGRQAAGAIDGGDYDVVFAHDCQLAQNPAVLRFLATPSVYYCHHGARSRLSKPDEAGNGHGFIHRAKVAYYALPRRFYPWLRERHAAQNIRQAGRVLTNSHFVREGFFRLYGLESQVAYLGVDTNRFRPLGLAREPFLLSVGAVHYHKGFRFLISALGRLPARQRLPLLIVANSVENEERQIIETLARQMGVDLTIRTVIDDQELVSLYNRAMAFVYTPIMEPWGLVVLEAMACGTPVVAVNEGGIRESVINGQTGLLADRDEEAFAATLLRLLSDRRCAEQFGQAAAADVQTRWTWPHAIDRLEQVFSRASSGRENEV